MKSWITFFVIVVGILSLISLFANSSEGTMVYKKNSSWSSSHAAVAELQEININLARIATALEKLANKDVLKTKDK